MNPKDRAALQRVPLHLLPAATRIHGALACKAGAMKYGPYNWREKPIDLMSYLGAIERHVLRLLDGEWVDDESCCTHLGHIIATAGILLDAEAAGTLIDKRPPLGSASRVLDEMCESAKEEELNE